MPKHSILFLIDCATSRLKVHNDNLEDLQAMLVALGLEKLGKVAVVVVIGQRLGLLDVRGIYRNPQPGIL